MVVSDVKAKSLTFIQPILPYVNPYSFSAFIVFLNVVYYQAQKWRRLRKERAFAAAHGCEPPNRLKHWLPWGLYYTREIMKADREHRVLQFICSLFDTRGVSFYGWFLNGWEVTTIVPENIEAVLNTNFQDYWFGPNRVRTFMPFFGSGIFTQDGADWKHSRSLLRPQFMHNRIGYFAHIQEQAKRLMASIEERAAGNKSGEIDLESYFFQYTLDTTTSILFGRPISTYDDQTLVEEYMDAFTNGQVEVIKRFRMGPLSAFLSDRKLKRYTQSCHKFVDGIVKEARENAKAGYAVDGKPLGEKQQHDNLLQSLLQLYPDDDIAVRSQLNNILLAGRDTTACLLTFTFRLLALHQNCLKKLYEEIAALPDVSELDRHDVRGAKAPYLTAVLNEVLRLYPSVPANQRSASRMTILPTGGGPDGKSPIFVPEGGRVSYCAYALHRRKDLWGEDANKFRPERWLENGGELEKRNALAYIPFNAGPRICLGQEMALTEAAAGVVHMLKVWNNGVDMVGDGELTADGETGKELQYCDIMVRPVNGCKVVLSRA